MKLIKYSLSFCSLFLISTFGLSQNNVLFNDSDLQFGISAKLNIEFSFKHRSHTPSYKFSLTTGVGYNIDNLNLYPTLHSGFLLFNNGAIGANQQKNKGQIQSQFFFNAIGTLMLDKRDFNYIERSVPLYHFAEFTANPLQNPFKSSLSYGAIWIFSTQHHHQRTGFFNANVVGRVQISYYNDGGPILGWAGDNRDRYYTGGVILSYHGNTEDIIDLVELSYHKYTGYQKYAFDVADKLQIDFLNYNDTNQFAYNQQRWRLNFSNTDNGFGGSVSIFNRNNLDFQDFLHFNTNVPYHPDYYRGYRWMFGARYEYNQIALPQ